MTADGHGHLLGQGFCLVLIVIAVFLGLIYQAVYSAREKREYPPPGRLMAADDYRLHIMCVGQAVLQ